MAKNLSEVNTEKYEGAGRITTVLGEITKWNIVGGAVAAVSTLPFLKSFGTMLVKVATLVQEQGDTPQAREAARNLAKEIKGSKVAVAGIVTGAAMAIFGVINGFRKMNKGRRQFEALKEQNEKLYGNASSLKQEVAGLKEQADTLAQDAKQLKHANTELHGKLEETTSRFAELAKSRTGKPHADAVPSKGEEGSLADAVIADKAQAASAEHTVH